MEKPLKSLPDLGFINFTGLYEGNFAADGATGLFVVQHLHSGLAASVFWKTLALAVNT